jgi:hypothetical protein
MTLSSLKADAARCNSRMVTARRTEPGTVKRGDPISGTAQAILAKARGREFTASDAANWTGRDIEALKYTLDAMLTTGLIRCRTVVLGVRIFREVR